MTRPLKVYRWVAMRSDARGPGNHHGQTENICAARSGAAVARIVGERNPRSLFQFGETWNDRDGEVARADPGVVFWKPLHPHNAPWMRTEQKAQASS